MADESVFNELLKYDRQFGIQFSEPQLNLLAQLLVDASFDKSDHLTQYIRFIDEFMHVCGRVALSHEMQEIIHFALQLRHLITLAQNQSEVFFSRIEKETK